MATFWQIFTHLGCPWCGFCYMERRSAQSPGLNMKTTTKKLILVLALGLFAAVGTARANSISILTITEANGTLTADLNGTAITLTLLGTTDNWSVFFPTGFSLNSFSATFLGEPENPLEKNIVAGFAGNPGVAAHLSWESDLGGGTDAPSIITIANAGSYNGVAFDLKLVDLGDTGGGGEGVPDGGATAMLLGIAFLSLVGVSRFKLARQA
jgi:hypothetical protein